MKFFNCRVLVLVAISGIVSASGSFLAFQNVSADDEEVVQDIILFDKYKQAREEAGGIPPANFSHLAHSKAKKCEDCHPKPFIKKIGGNDISEQKNMEGEFCGLCHGDKLSECSFCHREIVK